MILNDSLKANPVIASEFLEDPNRPGGPFRVSRKGEFSVLWTKFLFLSNHSDNVTFSKTLKWTLNLQKKSKTLFDGVGADDGTKYQYFFCAVSDSLSPVSFPPTLDVDSMFRYTDS